jgi:acyl-CoA thioesterase-2
MPDQTTRAAAVADLVDLLDLVPAGTDSFTGPSRNNPGLGRLYGGQVIAQSLVAAERTVADDRPVHSLHAYFLRGGAIDQPIAFDVARDLDGGTFSNRRVIASQAGRPILSMTASFQRLEQGYQHQDTMPDVPGPEELATEQELRAEFLHHLPAAMRSMIERPQPIEMRSVESRHWLNAAPAEPRLHTWFRSAAPLNDDPRLHRAMLAYASDFTMLGTSALPHGKRLMEGELMGVSLDHAIWFHDDFRADEWLLYVTQSPWAGRARGYNRGQIFTRDGRLVASLTQEGLLRPLGK